jgi:UDP-hydrolysing UDP-N-acetyl-D-glucosamine 2-epimerase
MIKQRLNICLITGSRAEYGLFKPLIREIKLLKEINLKLLVTGMHLSPEFGLSVQEIEADGYIVDEKIEMLLSADTDSAIVKSTALGMIGIVDALKRLSPDWVILIGDRFETFAAAFASYQAKIPIAHLHGGELTEGATDDAMRHSISKMAFLHFTSTEVYRKRVIQLGESPDRVFNVGAIGLDSLKTFKYLSKEKLSRALHFKLWSSIFVITFHPTTIENELYQLNLDELLLALDQFKTTQLIFTLPNADAYGRRMIKLINEYAQKDPERIKVCANLGQTKYFSLLKFVEIVIGNSSSGIIEVPTFNIPTINIGNRQEGRIKAASILDCNLNRKEIISAITTARSQEFKLKCKATLNPFFQKNNAFKIINQIKKTGKVLSSKKKFYDL